MTIVCTVLTGNKYSIDDVNKLYESLIHNTNCDFRFICYTDHEGDWNENIIRVPFLVENKKLQWYKVDFFTKFLFYKNKLIGEGESEAIIVMDIDLEIAGNVDFLFDPFNKDEFWCSHRLWWRWREDRNGESPVSGTVYKFMNGEFELDVYRQFEKDIPFWEEYFIKKKITVGPVNGEQHFIQAMLGKGKHNLKFFPEKHIVKWNDNDFYMQTKLEKQYKDWSGNNYLEDENGFHPDVRIIHYAGS